MSLYKPGGYNQGKKITKDPKPFPKSAITIKPPIPYHIITNSNAEHKLKFILLSS